MRRSFLLRLFLFAFICVGIFFALCCVRRMAVVASASDFFIAFRTFLCKK